MERHRPLISVQRGDAKLMLPPLRNVLTDIGVAGVAAGLVSPLVSIIDSAVVTRASTGNPMKACVKASLRALGKSPLALVLSRPFQLVFGVYFATYTTANVLDSAHAAKNSLPASTQSSSNTKFICTAAVSTATCTYKDGQLARMFTTASNSAMVRPQSYALFILRDAVTVWASFTLPVVMAPWLANFASTSQPGSYFRAFKSESMSLKTSQMLLPAVAQFLSTPIHLLGLDYHNNRGRITIRDRLDTVRRNVGVAIPMRIVRIVPAFGIGNLVNSSLREILLH